MHTKEIRLRELACIMFFYFWYFQGPLFAVPRCRCALPQGRRQPGAMEQRPPGAGEEGEGERGDKVIFLCV